MIFLNDNVDFDDDDDNDDDDDEEEEEEEEVKSPMAIANGHVIYIGTGD
jgi:hypothetical protein